MIHHFLRNSLSVIHQREPLYNFRMTATFQIPPTSTLMRRNDQRSNHHSGQTKQSHQLRVHWLVQSSTTETKPPSTIEQFSLHIFTKHRRKNRERILLLPTAPNCRIQLSAACCRRSHSAACQFVCRPVTHALERSRSQGRAGQYGQTNSLSTLHPFSSPRWTGRKKNLSFKLLHYRLQSEFKV